MVGCLWGVRDTMGVFDQASHYAVKLDPAGFFAWRVPRFAARFKFLGWLDVSTIAFPGEPDRVCDTVAEFKARDGDSRRLMDVECQTEPDGDMLERLGEYGLRLRREIRHGPGQGGKYPVVSLLLNLTGPVQSAELDLRNVELDGEGLHLRVTQGTLREEDAAATLARIASGEWERCVLPWLPLMRGGEDRGTIEEWKRLAQAEPNEPFGKKLWRTGTCKYHNKYWNGRPKLDRKADKKADRKADKKVCKKACKKACRKAKS